MNLINIKGNFIEKKLLINLMILSKLINFLNFLKLVKRILIIDIKVISFRLILYDI